MDDDGPGLRLGILGVVVLSLFSVLLARLVYLQVLAPGTGEVASTTNRLRVLPEEAPRGRIVDAKGRVLVDNRTALVVTVDRHELEQLPAERRHDLVVRLAGQLTRAGVPTKVAEVEHRLADPEYSPLLPVPVAIDVPDDLMVFLAERADEFPGVVVSRQTVRHYPQGSVAAHVLGYVGRISAPEYAAASTRPDRTKAYEPGSNVGKAGVEKSYEDELRGIPGEKQLEVDARGRPIRTVAERRPVPGNDIELTIDLDLQRTAEQRLAGQLAAVRGRVPPRGSNRAPFEGRAGAAVVIDPRNGDVTAMASYPTYDPSEFVNGISADAYRRLSGNGDPAANALLNRAIAGQYSPGSTFKLVTAYAALARGVITPRSTYDDQGSYLVGDTKRRNAEGASNGRINVTQAITASSDVFFYWIGDQFWSSRSRYGEGIQETAREFGLGVATGVALPGEAAGIVPDQAWKKQLFAALPPEQQAAGDPRWFGGDSANLAIGQGDLLTTPLQLANTYATFAAHGVRHRPNVVARVLAPGTDPTAPDLTPCAAGAEAPPTRCVVRVPETVVQARIDMPGPVYDAVHEGLIGATSSPRGTATALFAGFDQQAFPLFGKTGTVEAGAARADNAALVAAGPVGTPSVVALAYLEHAGFGADGAGPVVRTILDEVAARRPAPSLTPPSEGVR